MYLVVAVTPFYSFWGDIFFLSEEGEGGGSAKAM